MTTNNSQPSKDNMLQIEAGRHKNLLMADRLCVFCKELYIIVLEDEYLFVQNTSYSSFILTYNKY